MFAHRRSVIYTTIFVCAMLLASCTTSSAPKAIKAVPSDSATSATRASSPVSTPVAPKGYTAHVLLHGVGRPDDLTFDLQGHLLFTDAFNGTVSRVNDDGTATVLLSGLGAPEGMVVLPNGMMVVAEQQFQRIVAFAPGATMPTVLRVLPGTPSKARCKDGVDGVAFDATTNTLIVPDSPTGEVYRMSLDGTSLTRLAQGIVRPVGAMVDSHGTIYIADECGGAVWRITADGKTTSCDNFGMPDDVALDAQGNLLVIDLEATIHALIRLNMTTQQHETLGSQGFIEPQGLVVDAHDNIFVADDSSNLIMEFTPQ